MYCPVCFQHTLSFRPAGVIKLSFNGKSRNTSLFTYNLQKETQEQLEAKLKDKIADFFSFYSGFQNITPIKTLDIYSSDFTCTAGCKIDLLKSKFTVIGVLYSREIIQEILLEESKKFGIEIMTNLL